MRWVLDDATARQLLLEANDCRVIDSRRRYVTNLDLISFDDAETCTSAFAALVQRLLTLSEDRVAHYMVLDPDPVTYFHQHFGKYPIVSLRKDDTAETYLNLLNEDPGGNPSDAVGINCYEWVILPESHRWFVHCLRDADSVGGHLWIPASWIEEAVRLRPWLRHPPQSSFIVF